MEIAVILGSHRREGKNKDIENMLLNLNSTHKFYFIRMADTNISGCISCYKCAEKGRCVIEDDFESILNKLIVADAIFIITPVYASIPSRLTALFERLTSFLFSTKLINTENNPLIGKKTAVFNYCSTNICDENDIKLIFQKFVMTGYRFDIVNYDYMNNYPNADMEFNHDICEYVKSVVMSFLEE